jgi:hypothetical protein
MNLTSTHLEVHALENGLIIDGCMQIVDLKQQLSVWANHRGKR